MIGNDYRTARQAQDARYEDATGLPVGETNRQEYRDYFGVGDHAGTPVESRVTPRGWLADSKREDAPDWWITPAQAFQLTGRDLALLAASGDGSALDEIGRRAKRREAKAALKGQAA